MIIALCIAIAFLFLYIMAVIDEMYMEKVVFFIAANIWLATTLILWRLE